MKVSLDALQLKKRCLAPEESFWDVGEVIETPDNQFYVYRDNGSEILAVAHLDYVCDSRHFFVNRFESGAMIWNGQLDDRLGVHVILDVLPRYLGDTPYDILLTTGEESSRTTARHFKPPKGRKYNWMFSFDRKNDDVVTYGYTRHDWKTALEKDGGFKMGWGSFSCIRELENLGCCGANIGVGYEDYHGEFSHAWWPETVSQIKRFLAFYKMNWDTYWEHKPYVAPAPKENGGGWRGHTPYFPVHHPSNGVETPKLSGPVKTDTGAGEQAPTGPEESTQVVETGGVTYVVRKDGKGNTVTTVLEDSVYSLTRAMCPSCKRMGDAQVIDMVGMCEDCALDAHGLVCPHCHRSFTAEEWSFRGGSCYNCLLNDRFTHNTQMA